MSRRLGRADRERIRDEIREKMKQPPGERMPAISPVGFAKRDGPRSEQEAKNGEAFVAGARELQKRYPEHHHTIQEIIDDTEREIREFRKGSLDAKP